MSLRRGVVRCVQSVVRSGYCTWMLFHRHAGRRVQIAELFEFVAVLEETESRTGSVSWRLRAVWEVGQHGVLIFLILWFTNQFLLLRVLRVDTSANVIRASTEYGVLR